MEVYHCHRSVSSEEAREKASGRCMRDTSPYHQGDVTWGLSVAPSLSDEERVCGGFSLFPLLHIFILIPLLVEAAEHPSNVFNAIGSFQWAAGGKNSVKVEEWPCVPWQ